MLCCQEKEMVKKPAKKAPSDIEQAGEHKVDYGASSSLNESEGKGEGEGEEASVHEVVDITDDAEPSPKPSSDDGQEPPPIITYSYDNMVLPATVTYKCHSPPIREVILKMIGSEKESTASQIEFLQSIDFNKENWLIAMHDAEVINLICFSHGTQFHYCLYT